MLLSDFTAFFGVDFSGAKLAGRNAWVARCEAVPPHPRPRSRQGRGEQTPRLVLTSLDRLEDLAGTADLLEKTPLPDGLTRQMAEDLKKIPKDERIREHPYLSAQKKRVAFLRNFAKQMAVLKGIAQKELAQKPLDAAETKFLEDVVESAHIPVGSGSVPGYGGWYIGLYYEGYFDSVTWDAIVADVHTNTPAGTLGDPGCVLHQGVGNVDLLLVAVDNGKDRTVYAGPVMSHYEFEMPGVQRMSDREWKERLEAGKAPPRPGYTKAYLVPGENPDAKKYGNILRR